MSADKFNGKISLGKEPSYDDEMNDAMEAYLDYGFKQPSDLTKGSFLTGLAGAFLTGEMPPADKIPDLSPASKQYFGNEVRPVLARAAEAGDDRAVALARKTGALVSAYFLKYPQGLAANEKFQIGEDAMTVDGITQEYTVETGIVVDYGMGMMGLMNHIKAAKDDRYRVVGLQKTQGETAVLQAIAHHRGLSADQMKVYSGGISKNASRMIDHDYERQADLVIASRVHSAGSDLEAGIDMTPRLLREGGLLVARGPRRYSKGTDYDKLLRRVKNNPKLTLVANEARVDMRKNHGREDTRTFMAVAK